jgi:predicted nucleic acid-binding protein
MVVGSCGEYDMRGRHETRATVNLTTPAAVFEWGLGAGEAAVIAAALEGGGRTAVLDDAQGRKCARALACRSIVHGCSRCRYALATAPS